MIGASGIERLGGEGCEACGVVDDMVEALCDVAKGGLPAPGVLVRFELGEDAA